MTDAVALGSNGFAHSDTLPEAGQTIIVECWDDGRVVHLHGVVTDVVPGEGRISIEHPPGVARHLWFPAVEAAWREAVEREVG